MPQNVVLPGPAPWGFRLSGGIDFNQPLIITRVGVLPSFAASRGTPWSGGWPWSLGALGTPLPGTRRQLEGRPQLGKARFGGCRAAGRTDLSAPRVCLPPLGPQQLSANMFPLGSERRGCEGACPLPSTLHSGLLPVTMGGAQEGEMGTLEGEVGTREGERKD